MLFDSAAHEHFYKEKVQSLSPDCYLEALIYTLGISADTRERWNQLYDEQRREINPDAINEGWITSGTARLLRLAFQLYTDGTPTCRTDTDIKECRQYSVSDIFCCSFAPYYMEAVKIRYPEYCRNITIEPSWKKARAEQQR